MCSIKKTFFVVSTVLLAAVCGSPMEVATAPLEPIRAAAKSVDALAMDLYPRIGNAGQNLLYSPHSISVTLAMAHAGAKDQTRADMAKVLHFDPELDLTGSGFAALVRELHATARTDGCQLSVCNALWAQRGVTFLPEFLRVVLEVYQGQAIQIDFMNDPKEAQQAINEEVAKKTEGKIYDLIPSGLIDTMTRLVLTNAIYFKGDWARPFAKELTTPDEFKMADGTKVETQFMNESAVFGYMEGENFQVLEIPYKGKGFSMIVLLPAEETPLSEFEKKISWEKIEQWTAGLKEREVIVSLPRFTITTPSCLLGKTLAGMGMADAFSPRADFSAINGQKDLQLGEVAHKAFIEVNETGSESAAATAVTLEFKSMGPSPLPAFIADRPFMFLIRHKKTGCVLFMGRLANPS